MAPSTRGSQSALQARSPPTCDALFKSPVLIDYLLGVDLWHGRFVARALTRLVEKSDLRFRWVPRGTSCSQPLTDLAPLEQRFVGVSLLPALNPAPFGHGMKAPVVDNAIWRIVSAPERVRSQAWLRPQPSQGRRAPGPLGELPPREPCWAASAAAVGTAGRRAARPGPPYGCS